MTTDHPDRPTDSAAARDLVRRGYDEISTAYRSGDEARFAPGAENGYRRALAAVLPLLPAQAEVLDLGCGCGVPVAADLVAAGCRVTGVDFSVRQIQRARELVPGARFIDADMTEIEFPPESFDAVVAFYSIIHVPVAQQPDLLARIAAWLRPGGRAVLTTGYQAWTGTEAGWHGGTLMWWSHADAPTYRTWLRDAGLVIESESFVAEGDGGHALFRTRRPAGHGTGGPVDGGSGSGRLR